MLEQIEALRALAELGTTGRAATRLRITQSAVSKRISALEVHLGVPLVEPAGRRVRLTPAALRVLDEVAPLLRELEDRLARLGEAPPAPVRLAATESLLATWLPAILRDQLDAAPGPGLELHAHRGRLALDRLRAGEVDLALCVGGDEDGLVTRELGTEPMVVVPSRGTVLPDEGPVEVWTIEPGSLTGAWLALRLPRVPDARIRVVGRIEAFGSAVRLAQAGFGHALVPLGVARASGAEGRPIPGLARPITLYGRPGAWARPAVRALGEGIAERAREALRA